MKNNFVLLAVATGFVAETFFHYAAEPHYHMHVGVDEINGVVNVYGLNGSALTNIIKLGEPRLATKDFV